MELIESLHRPAQYLAAAGISFLEKRVDDSHTNLEWDAANGYLLTRSFGAHQSQLALDLKGYALIWLNNGKLIASQALAGTTHETVLGWIAQQAQLYIPTKKYVYAFHYDLPYPKLTNDFVFNLPDDAQVIGYMDRLTVAHQAFSHFLKSNNLTSEVRVWPHHFDLGIYTQISEEHQLSMGAGLAIPDTVESEPYVYATGWLNGVGMETKSFPELNIGKWHTNWKGGTLLAEHSSSIEIQAFLNEAKRQFLKVTS